jgi:hypothetical protein
MGLHFFSASYSGTSSLRPSVSPVVIERVPLTGPDFSPNLSSSSISVPQGQSTSFAATVNSINGFNRTVSPSCEVEAPGMSCQLAPAILPNGEGTAILTINTHRSQRTASLVFANRIDLRTAFLGVLLLSSIAILTSLLLGRRAVLSLTCLICAITATGCASYRSGTTTALTPVGNYVITVTANSANPPVRSTHSALITITVEPPAK